MKEKIREIIRHPFLKWGLHGGVGLMTTGMIIVNMVSLQKENSPRGRGICQPIFPY